MCVEELDGLAYAVDIRNEIFGVCETTASTAEPLHAHYHATACVQPAFAPPHEGRFPTRFATSKPVVTFLRGSPVSVTLWGQVDSLTLQGESIFDGMPEARCNMTWGMSDLRESTTHAGSRFNCNYCGYPHPSTEFSREHVVPQALLNKNYVLNDTCGFVNNYFANAFETSARHVEVIKELLLLFDPSKKPVFRGPATSSSGTEMTRWVVNGRSELYGPTSQQLGRECNIKITLPSGERVPFTLQLPFEIIKRATGPLWSHERRVASDKKRVEAYLRELVENPDLDTRLARELRTTGGKFERSTKGVMLEPQASSKGLPETFRVNLPGDDELLTKLFYKIAWCYAVKTLGRQLVMAQPFASGMFRFLMSEHIADVRFVDAFPKLFSNPRSIQGAPYHFWRYDLETTEREISKFSAHPHFYALMRLYDYRRMKAQFVRSYIRFDNIPIDDEFLDTLGARRFHRLSLKTENNNSISYTTCDVSLFGGALSATVPIAEEILCDKYPEPTVIRLSRS